MQVRLWAPVCSEPVVAGLCEAVQLSDCHAWPGAPCSFHASAPHTLPRPRAPLCLQRWIFWAAPGTTLDGTQRHGPNCRPARGGSPAPSSSIQTGGTGMPSGVGIAQSATAPCASTFGARAGRRRWLAGCPS